MLKKALAMFVMPLVLIGSSVHPIYAAIIGRPVATITLMNRTGHYLLYFAGSSCQSIDAPSVIGASGSIIGDSGIIKITGSIGYLQCSFSYKKEDGTICQWSVSRSTSGSDWGHAEITSYGGGFRCGSSVDSEKSNGDFSGSAYFRVG